MPKPILLVLPGDGIGPEVVEQATRVLDWIARAGRIDLELRQMEIGGVSIERHGRPLTDEVLDAARRCDAILLGSVGGPQWDFLPNPAERAGHALLTLRKTLDLFANLRPIQVFDGLEAASTLKPEIIAGVDLIIVRELTGGIYFGEPRGVVVDARGERQGRNTLAYSEGEVRRVARIAFELARSRRGILHSVDKANVLETMGMWRDVVLEMHATEFGDILLDHMFVDNAAMQLVRNPRQFDVVVTDNMFGDILSDCAAMVSGSLGMLPSASFGDRRNGSGGRLGLFEPVHGSAPDIAGQGVANPLATILSLGMLLRHSLSLDAAADRLLAAVATVLREGYRTRDLAGTGTMVTTDRMGDAVLAALAQNERRAA